MRWLHPSTTPTRSIVIDVFAGVLTAMSVTAVIATTPWWPHGICGTGVNDPVQYAFGLVPFGLRCLLVWRVKSRRQPLYVRGFEVMPPQPGESAAA
jgi:hypothetical protein